MGQNPSLPSCKFGAACIMWVTDPAHETQFSHPCKAKCETGCKQIDNVGHMTSHLHPFLPPCRFRDGCTKKLDSDHTRTFSHRCKWGAACRDMAVPAHTTRYYHL
eukprot:gnl/Hemi2/23719_TR7961_c0_g1_i1.p2 gnl/Hemi2/23719_TR7961_c0_g1~~gnl/Hemi2/23719_TR7961_c0_g1_i1.p2  ORF type:complete len:105 (+),score=16.56 gnl/Hemi2/23719_TR7961_c0_g1_i1:129-443(+)